MDVKVPALIYRFYAITHTISEGRKHLSTVLYPRGAYMASAAPRFLIPTFHYMYGMRLSIS